MLGTTFPAASGRTFTSLISKLTAVVAQLLFLYHIFMVSNCYECHAFSRSMIAQIAVHTCWSEVVALLKLFCQQKCVKLFQVSVTSFKLPIVVGTSILQLIICCHPTGFSTYFFRISIKSSSPHCSHSSSFCIMITLTGSSLSKSV